MASATIRNVDKRVKRRLPVHAAENGRSMEQEARDIPGGSISAAMPPKDLGRAIHARSCGHHVIFGTRLGRAPSHRRERDGTARTRSSCPRAGVVIVSPPRSTR